MDKQQALVILRAALIEFDRGIMMQHSALGGIIKTIEKLLPAQNVNIKDTDNVTGFGNVYKTGDE